MFSFLNIRSETRHTSDVAMRFELVPFGGPTQIFFVPDSVPQHDLSSLSYHVVRQTFVTQTTT